MTHLKTGTATEAQPVHEKLQAIISNVQGAAHFLKAFADFTIMHDDWEDKLKAIIPNLEVFLNNRNASITSFADLVNYGALFITTQDHFLRAEHIKENLKLTKEELEEIKKEVDDSFYDDKTRASTHLYAATVGWKIQEIAVQYINVQEIEEAFERKMRSIRLNMYAQTIVSDMGKSLISIETGLVLAQKLLVDVGVQVMSDGTVEATTERGKEALAELASPDYQNTVYGVLDATQNVELECIDTPLAKLLCECTTITKLG